MLESPWLRAGQRVPGWGGTSALTSCSLPWAGVGERGIVSWAAQPSGFPAATLWVALAVIHPPSARARPGREPLVHTGPACLPRLSGLPAARAAGQRDLQRRCLPLNLLPSVPALQLSAQRRPPARRGPEPGDREGARSGRRGPSRLSPRLFQCHYRRASRSSSAFPLALAFERKGSGWPRAARSRRGCSSKSPPRLLPVPRFHARCNMNALAPGWTQVSPGLPSPRPPSPQAHGHVLGTITITSSLGPLSVPSLSVPSPTREACPCGEPGGSKRKRGARLLQILRAHVAQASAPLG